MNELGKYIQPPLYEMKELNKETYPEIENLDVPGVDNFSEYRGLFWCWQQALPIENIYGIKGHTGRWVITNSITNPLGAYTAYYNGDYFRLDQAIEAYKKELNGPKS